jgi:hypothetical protein
VRHPETLLLGTQRSFEERLERHLDALDARLEQQLGELDVRLVQQLGGFDASIRRAIDAVLGHRLTAIRRDQTAEHDSLEGGLRDVAAGVRRLESKLDRFSAAAAAPPLGERSDWGNGGQRRARTEPSMQRSASWSGDHSDWRGGAKDRRQGEVEDQRHSNREGDARVRLAERKTSRSLLDVIERVCEGDGPAIDTMRERLRLPNPGQRLESWNLGSASDRRSSRAARSDARPISERQAKPWRAAAVCGGWQSPIEDREERLGRLAASAPDPHLSMNQPLDSESQGTDGDEAHGAGQEGGCKGRQSRATDAALQLVGTSNNLFKAESISGAAAGVEVRLDALTDWLGKRLERIAYALGIRNLNTVDNSADDGEDRKRLMEKLKSAFDADRRRRLSAPATNRDRYRQ